METRKILAILVLALGLMVCQAEVSEAGPMGTAITYQGRLIDANSTADGLYDFAFKLYDANVGGSKAANDVNVADVDVIDGYFTVVLDFNDPCAFNGDARWLDIGVRPGELEDPNGYTPLSPRQEVTPTPYAIYAQTAGSDNDWMVSGNEMYSIPSGNVGIGTTTPGKLLHIVKKDGGYDGLGICLDPHGGGFVGGTTWHIDNDGDFKLTESRALPGYPRTRFTISEGNVGIGTMSPVDLLEVASDSLAAVTLSTYSSAGADNPSELVLRRARGTMAAPSAILSGDVIGWIFGDGYGSTTWPDIGPGINFVATENWTDTALGSRIGFYTIRNGTNVEVEAMRIDQSGNIGIGTTNPGARLQVGDTDVGHDVYIAGSTNSQSGLFFYDGGIPGGMRYNFSTDDLSIFTSGSTRVMIDSAGDVGIGTLAPTEKLDVDGTARLRGISNGAGSPVVADANGTLWKTVSSKRYKRNIADLEIDADAVLELRPVSFQYKSSGQKDIGLIAEEVQKQLPDLVIYDEQGRPDAVKYDKVSLYLLAVVKELKAENQSLRQRLEALEKTRLQHQFSVVKEVQR